MLSRAIDLGFSYVDTANNYGNGKSEERVGRLTPRRGEVIRRPSSPRWPRRSCQLEASFCDRSTFQRGAELMRQALC